MPIPLTVSNTDIEIHVNNEEEIPKVCQHGNHWKGKGHHDSSAPVMEVNGRTMPCCGFHPRIRYLCLTFCRVPSLYCPKCHTNNIPFEQCFQILGPVE